MGQVDIKTIYNDTKKLVTGNDGSDKEPDDFKTELKRSINQGIISKADGSLCMESRKAADEQGQKIDKLQEKYVQNALDGEEYDSPEEEQEQEAIKKKKEKERKKREQQAEVIKKANNKPKSNSKSKTEKPKEKKQEDKEKIKEE